jgi:hypothetical protein
MVMKKLKIKAIRLWRGLYNVNDNITTDSHNTSACIFRKALRDRSAELIIMPILNKRIIKIEKKGLFIVLQYSLLEITNHKYSYHLEINHNMYTKLSRMFDQKLEFNYKIEEKIIDEQLNGGLKKVLNLFNKQFKIKTMAVKNYKAKIEVLNNILINLNNLQNDSSNSFLELECSSSEESDFNILIDTPICNLISSVEQFIENIEEDVYDNEIESENYDNDEFEW